MKCACGFTRERESDPSLLVAWNNNNDNNNSKDNKGGKGVSHHPGTHIHTHAHTIDIY
jgi:hypothetical protein